MKKPWTTSELATLRDLRESKRLSVGKIGQVMGRSRHSIRWKLAELGISIHDGERQRWMDCEDEWLRINYGKMPMSELCQKLGRSEAAIFKRRQILKLKARDLRAWDDDQRDFLTTNVGTMTAREIGAIIGKSTQAVRNFKQRNGIK